jgi:hypothetical protein
VKCRPQLMTFPPSPKRCEQKLSSLTTWLSSLSLRKSRRRYEPSVERPKIERGNRRHEDVDEEL